MKKTVIFIFLVVGISLQSNAQKSNKVDFYIFDTLGYGVITNTDTPNYNSNTAYLGGLFNYRFYKNNGICIGITETLFKGTGFLYKGTFYNEKNILAIPLMYTSTSEYNKFRFVCGVGLEATKVLKDSYSFLQETDNKPFENGWGFGLRSMLILSYKVTHILNLGVFYSGGGDFSKNKAFLGSTFQGEQSVKMSNQIGLNMSLSF